MSAKNWQSAQLWLKIYVIKCSLHKIYVMKCLPKNGGVHNRDAKILKVLNFNQACSSKGKNPLKMKTRHKKGKKLRKLTVIQRILINLCRMKALKNNYGEANNVINQLLSLSMNKS